MRLNLLEIAAAIALTLAAIIASVSGANASDIAVTGAFARASATPMAKSGAVYLTIVNHASEADRLLAISTPAASSAELHQSVMDGDVMKMEPKDNVELLPGATLEMGPGGLHLMLTGLSAPLKQGGSIEMVLTFEKAGDMKVTVTVEGVAANHASGG